MTEEITITGIIKEELEKAGGLTRTEIALLTGLGKEKVDSGLKRLYANGTLKRELIPSDEKPRGPLPYTWSIKNE